MSSVIRATALAEALYTAALKAGAKPATIARAIVYHGDNTKAGLVVETSNGPVPYEKAGGPRVHRSSSESSQR